MAFLDSSTAVIDAILTRKGRELLARNDGRTPSQRNGMSFCYRVYYEDILDISLLRLTSLLSPAKRVLFFST
jgi:hypothetical protein